VDAGQTNRYTLRCPPALLHPPGLTIATAWHLDDLIRVQQREASRFVRPREDWEAVLQPPATFEPGRARQVVVAASAGTPLAYAVADVKQDMERQPADAGVIEYAGAAGAVRGLLAHCLAQPGVETLHVTVPMQAVAVARLLRQVAEPTPGGIPETVRLIDPLGLVWRLRPYLAERLGAATATALYLTAGERGTYTLRLRAASVVVPDRAALTWLLVGTHQRERLAWVEAAPPAQRRALAAAFPIPLPLPGLNWV
jgi:hypothetical protein